jgi:acyl carrier protein
VREGGAYLFVGALDGRNGLLAAALARTPGVRIAAIGPDAAASHVPGAAEVLPLAADPADAEALAAAVAEAERRFGRLDGVICAPAVAALSALAPLAEADPAAWLDALAGLRAELDALDSAIGARALDFRLIESSLTGVLGGVGRGALAAANAVVEAFAQSRPGWTSVAWDRWAVDDRLPEGDELWVLPGDVPAALRAVLAHASEPSVWVSTGDLDARIAESGRPAPAARPVDGAGGHGRPELGTEYHAATSEVEERLVAMWQELLGISRIGIHDDFFALGGHSLMAMQIISRVRTTFQVDVSLVAIFEAPTVARFAALVEDAILAELEGMTDEEAMALME